MFAEIRGKLLFSCGEDKIVYGPEAPIWQPQSALDAFRDFTIAQDVCEGDGSRSSPTRPSGGSSGGRSSRRTLLRL
jgi:hypothetical protein